jgi:hypothetical protein
MHEKMKNFLVVPLHEEHVLKEGAFHGGKCAFSVSIWEVSPSRWKREGVSIWMEGASIQMESQSPKAQRKLSRSPA